MDKKLEFADLFFIYRDAWDNYQNARATTDDYTSEYQEMKRAEQVIFDWVDKK